MASCDQKSEIADEKYSMYKMPTKESNTLQECDTTKETHGLISQ